MMKTSEFIRKVINLGYNIREYRMTLEISNDVYVIGNVSIQQKNIIDIEESINDDLFNLIFEYAKTPIEEREEQEKYVWKLRGNNQEDYGEMFYLNYHTEKNHWFLNNKIETRIFKTQFTEKEFADYEKKFNIKNMFVKEELNK